MVTLNKLPSAPPAAHTHSHDTDLTGVSANDHHTEDHDHDGSPTQQLLAANTHGSPSPDTHHAQITVQDEGTPLTQRSTLNYIGRFIEASDTGSITQVEAGGFTYDAIVDGTGTLPHHYTTIQLALDNAANNTSIFVRNGTYAGFTWTTQSCNRLVGESLLGVLVDSSVIDKVDVQIEQIQFTGSENWATQRSVFLACLFNGGPLNIVIPAVTVVQCGFSVLGRVVINAGFQKVFTFDDSAASFTDNTTEARSRTGTNFTILGDGDLSNIVYFGLPGRFTSISMNLSTNGSGGVLTWEYWDGAAWSALTGLSGNTNLTLDSIIAWTMPSNWATTTVNAVSALYWVRARVTTAYVTDPVCIQAMPPNAVGVRIVSNVAIALVSALPDALFKVIGIGAMTGVGTSTTLAGEFSANLVVNYTGSLAPTGAAPLIDLGDSIRNIVSNNTFTNFDGEAVRVQSEGGGALNDIAANIFNGATQDTSADSVTTIVDGGDGIDASQTTIGVADGSSFRTGHKISFPKTAGGTEDCIVVSVSSNTLTVQRGGYGSTAGAASEGVAISRFDQVGIVAGPSTIIASNVFAAVYRAIVVAGPGGTNAVVSANITSTNTLALDLSANNSAAVMTGNDFSGSSTAADIRGNSFSPILIMSGNKVSASTILGGSSTKVLAVGNQGHGVRGAVLDPEVDAETDIGTFAKRYQSYYGSGGKMFGVKAAQTTSYSPTANDHVIPYDASGGALTPVLPAAASHTGRHYVLKKIDSSTNTVTVDGNGTETIDGALTYVLARQWDTLEIVSDSANWQIVAAKSSGTYTPTLTNTTNITASTAYQCQFMRVGNIVTVSGKADITATLGLATQLDISLPIPSNFGAQEDCAGTASASAVNEQASMRGSVANDRAEVNYIAISLVSQPWYFTFTYEVI